MTYRKLTEEEIKSLILNGSFCEDWSTIEVHSAFSPHNIRNVSFSGNVKIGLLLKKFTSPGGVPKQSGIYNATIHNCIIDDDVYINQVKNHLANYHIKKNVIIENVDSLFVSEETSFGNGIRVAVLNETGGREIAMYDELSAHTAYLMAFYRHRPILIDQLLKKADDFAKGVTSAMGTIEEGAHLVNCRTIQNVRIGKHAFIEGVYRLVNGTINSSLEDPSYIGPGVIAQDFITASGSEVTESSMISKCFVGQGTVLAKQYSAENSVFFANCQGFHGEACSIFAGPYTVSHHKSTLLIAGYYSFLNAGSGSNQSNHMYKLGPIHQGVVERGSKTTSDSYLLWPAKIGAFSLVMGRHYRNPDTADLPFSYLIENTDESFLAPGVNLRSIGTIRDARKWPRRDRRKDPVLLDAIVFNLLSPYSIQKMIKGIKVLNDLKSTSGPTSEYYMYNSVKITASALDRGIQMYRIGITKFLGNGLVKKLELADFSNREEMLKAIAPEGKQGSGEWVDMAGLLVPKEEVDQLVNDVEKGIVTTAGELNKRFVSFKNHYFDWAWNWIVPRLKTEAGLDVESVSVQQVMDYVEEWKNAVVKLDQMMYEDARKEFTLKSQTGFGIDGKEETRMCDFENVRGEFTSHPAVTDILEHIEKKSNLASKVLDKLSKIL
ncbi:DUF4954 family protein [Alkalitalea saponilacus]|uniref:DUF4954 domain-containing protein n=1 Tax=Alkalitalea saponilacus TaxID=889453 RepID=A0A1T5FAH8_9BACT|nr:DUF4954 family protein [Alkalitalea saponilacus]ASB50095.1 DUF4954 domain-containing protein [Alkalitalea saponilacus]SKB93183.1 protein of unknown function [Alkalitalea saponilacus]